MLNVVQGIGEEVGAALVSHPLVRRVSFTGSTETARRIGQTAASNIVPFTAELGGKNPLIVFADADLDAAAQKAAGQYDDAGQVCLSGTRLLVEESVLEPFLERFHAAVDAQVLGDPADDATTISPLIHPDHLARVSGFVERARADGQRVVRGGRQASEIGPMFYEPTLIEPTSNDAEIVQNEVFGPVLCYQTFATEQEAVALANSTAYGLSGDRLHLLDGPRGPDRPGRPRRRRVGQHVPRPRPHRTVRRRSQLRHRPRGRRLRPGLLLRPEDAADPRWERVVSEGGGGRGW